MFSKYVWYDSRGPSGWVYLLSEYDRRQEEKTGSDRFVPAEDLPDQCKMIASLIMIVRGSPAFTFNQLQAFDSTSFITQKRLYEAKWIGDLAVGSITTPTSRWYLTDYGSCVLKTAISKNADKAQLKAILDSTDWLYPLYNRLTYKAATSFVEDQFF